MERILGRLERLYMILDRRLGGRPSLLVRTGLAFDQDDGPVVSRSIAYYALFSLFPLILVLLSFSNSFLNLEEAQRVVVELVSRFMPASAELVETHLDQVLKSQGTIGYLALLSLIWSASGVFSAMYRAVNRAWGNPKSKLFWTEKIFGLVVVFAVGLLLLSTTIYSTFVSVMQSWRGLLFGEEIFPEQSGGQLWSWLSNLAPALVSVVTFIILYRIIPRNRVTWRDVWVGGLVAGLVWDLARRLYAWYLASFASYSLIYGSVGAIIGFLLWAYLSAMILLLGAELSAQRTAWHKAGSPLETRPPREWTQEWTK